MIRVALAPVWDVGMAAASLVIAKDAPNFNTELDSDYDPDAKKTADGAEQIIPIEDVNFPKWGSKYGRLTCRRIGLDSPVYWGDDNAILRSGAGHSTSTFLPGFGRTIIMCAHNTTFFKPLKDVEVDDVITFDTTYETYEYRVTEVKVMHENDLAVKMNTMLLDEQETLLLYTCYPFRAISGRKTKRLAVFCERISGLDVEWREA